MKRQYPLGRYRVSVTLEEGLIRVANTPQLRQGLAGNPVAKATALMEAIKADHLRVFGRALAVSDESLVAELFGHLYAAHLLLKYNRLFQFIFPNKLYKRLLRSCEVTDCGERSKDPNRWVWDGLTFLRVWLAQRLSGYFAHVDGDNA